MSWSITYVGKAENIVKALNDYSGKVAGQTKLEFDDALPHLVGILNQNFSEGGAELLSLTASGSGWAADGKQVSRNLQVKLERLYGVVV